MSGTATTITRDHPITVAAADMHTRLDQLTEQSTWSMTDPETRSTLAELTRAEARIAELKLRVAAHAETNRVGDESGATSTAAWWATATNQTKPATHRLVKLAAALDTDRHQPVRAALAAGELLVDQSAVIVHAVDALPDDVSSDLVAKAEAILIRYAHDFNSKHLRILGKRIYQVIDPEAAEAHEAKLLEDEERNAKAAARFRMSDDGHGKTHGRFTLPTSVAEMLKKALLAYAAPKHRAAVDGKAQAPGRPTDHRMGEAFIKYIENYPADDLPNAGGTDATVVVTMDLDALLGGLKAARLDTGHTISAAEARRLACEAGIIPAVLDGSSQVLDLGRKQRFHSKAQRIAAGIQQGGCTAEGCDWPPGMCHMHHPEPWSRGGETNRDGVLLCPRHHTLAHDTRYQTTRQPNGKIRFHRRV